MLLDELPIYEDDIAVAFNAISCTCRVKLLKNSAKNFVSRFASAFSRDHVATYIDVCSTAIVHAKQKHIAQKSLKHHLSVFHT